VPAFYLTAALRNAVCAYAHPLLFNRRHPLGQHNAAMLYDAFDRQNVVISKAQGVIGF